jgi:hypothetical protein
MSEPPVSFDAKAVRDAIFASNAAVQERFRSEFPQEIARAIRGVAAAHRALDLFRTQVAPSQQAAALEMFFHSAVNSVLVSLHHLACGYLISSGSLMRHYTESVSMALLCLDPKLGVLQAFVERRNSYAVHKAPERLRQKKVRASLRELIEFDADAWETVMKISELYDHFSHASALALASQLMLDEENLFILGGEYDPAKREAYRSDLVRRATAAESLAHLIEVVTERLNSWQSHGEGGFES